MEVPVINRISDFETGFTSLQDPTLFTQFFAISGIGKVPQFYWKWVALILAILLASFSTIINKIKTLILKFQSHPLISSPGQDDWDDLDTESDTATEYSFSDDSDSDGEEDIEDEDDGSSWRPVDEDFSVKGSGHRCENDDPLSELANGKNAVVKLWDNLGFGFGLNLSDGGDARRDVVSFYDMDREERISSIYGETAAVYTLPQSPAVVVSADRTGSGNLFRVWDTRVGCRIPEILAEWRPMLGRIVGVNVEKVYVRDDVSCGLTVGDIRKVKSPFVHVTESDGGYSVDE